MAGANSTTICYDASLQQCSSSIICSHESMAAFRKTMGGALWRVNMLVLVNAILAGVIVSIGATVPMPSATATTPSRGSSTLEPAPCSCRSHRTSCLPLAPTATITPAAMSLQPWQPHAVEAFTISQPYHGRSLFRSQ